MRFSREGIGGDQRTILRGRQGGGGYCEGRGVVM